MSDLYGRVAIVTGAGKGLGRAYALHLAASGAAVLVNNRRHPGEADADTSAARTVATIHAMGGRASANWDDVTADGAGERMVAAARDAFGRLDAVVANAGVSSAAPFHKTDMPAFRAVFDPSFYGTLALLAAAWPHLITAGYGRLVMTASSAGLYGVHGMAAYAAAKGAVIGLMRSLAIEGRSVGIKANVIMPYAYSQMTAPYMDATHQTRLDPERVAPLVSWLASEACAVTGEMYVSGGGRIARAAAGETAAVAYNAAANVDDQVRALSMAPLHEHLDATAAFTAFMRDHTTA